MKPKVLFFSRSFLVKYFSEFKSDFFESFHVVLTVEERIELEKKGFHVYGCFEEEYDKLNISQIKGNYLKTSFVSDRFLQRFNLEKRLEILGKEITFWRNLLETLKPDYLFNETVAIEIAEVMAIEAERLQIPFFTSLLGFLPYTFYWKPNPFHGSLYNLSNIAPNEDNILKAKEYYCEVLVNNFKPFYVQDFINSSNFSLKNLLSSLFKDTSLYFKKIQFKRIKYFKYEDDYSFLPYHNTKRILNRLRYNYNNLTELNEKHLVFYPLHFEPEATLNYFAEENQNQVSTIELIIRTLKPYQYLVIKEHPQQKGELLSNRFRDLKKKFSNIIYLPAEVNSQDIIKKSEAIITLTSTAAWEAIIFGKPVFVLGKIFYDQCTGVIKIESYNQLKEEIRKEEYVYPIKEEVILFIAKMISIFHKGCPTPDAKCDLHQNAFDYFVAIEELIENRLNKNE
ncbi:MAG: hypothetical protein WCL70_05535 [Paludibacter sp.]